ncbi:hypothetical protein TSAR_012852 [Trichomalopsis sarcophagae]|uniref:Uncharacterized protein n=1 Tax=Trichomalopsis sarcophagae TaxID=543379 RepID=A0A232EGF9_9HYME|nr:hypothetical protein TSAR_012852 [Trichomalopsis sarcophagae]
MSKNNFRTLFSHRTPHSRKLQISESAFPTPIYQISKIQPLLPQGDFTANFTGLIVDPAFVFKIGFCLHIYGPIIIT